MNEKTTIKLQNFANALNRLEEAVSLKELSSLDIDGTIQRFEFTFEACWKAMKALLMQEGVEALSPRKTIQQAYQQKWIDDEALWLKMLQDRNLTTHVYSEEQALAIFESIKHYLPELKRVYLKLKDTQTRACS